MAAAEAEEDESEDWPSMPVVVAATNAVVDEMTNRRLVVST